MFCDAHREHSLPLLIREYVHIRFLFEEKRYKEMHFSKLNTQCKTKGKMKNDAINCL